MAEQDLYRLVNTLWPVAGGEDVLRLRTGKIEALNADGTVDVSVSGVVLEDIKTLASAYPFLAEDSLAYVAQWRGALLVLGSPAVTGTVQSVARGVVGTPTTTTFNGTATAANTTEVRDAVLGDYVFTAEADRWYQVCYVGALSNSGSTDNPQVTNVRDGGVSTPTTASAMVASSTVQTGNAAGTNGRSDVHVLSVPLQFSTGTHTLSLFTQSPESQVLTPVPNQVGTRALYVVDIGGV